MLSLVVHARKNIEV